MDNAELVRRVATEAQVSLQERPATQIRAFVMGMVDYHGFKRYRLPDNMSATAMEYRGEVHFGLVRVDRNLSHQVHFHERAYTHTICLGREEHLPNPSGAISLPDGRPCHAGRVIITPPKVAHGFTVRQGGILYFLSAQTPPILRGDDDDYHLCEN